MKPSKYCLLGLIILLSFTLVRDALACIGCSPTVLETQAQLFHRSNVVLFGKWLETKRGDDKNPAETKFEVITVAKDKTEEFKSEQTVVLDQYIESSKGKTFLLLGFKEGSRAVRWERPEATSKASYEYLTNAPSPELPTHERLKYYVKFLDSSEDYVSQDAYNEFAFAPFEDVEKIKDSIPVDKVRKWLADPKTPTTRWGLYGVLLGLAGTPDDAELMLSKFEKPSEDFRLGVEGIMTGYLMLVGEQGLDTIERTKLVSKDAKFSETYAAMQTLRYMWKYVPGRIPPERLKAAMRTLLERPELADIVIPDLARWEDWAVVDRLVKMYHDEEFKLPAIKKAIIRYLLECEHSWDETKGAGPPEYVVAAREAREKIQAADPKVYRDATRFSRFK